MEVQSAWDDFMAEVNSGVENEKQKAWHTAHLWVRSSALESIKNSTILSMVISVLCAFLGALVFTMHPILSGAVTCTVLCILSCQLFTMVNILGWSIGPIEVIALIVFVGYSVTYCMHVAHSYAVSILSGSSKEEERWRRTEEAVQSMGGAIFGSALTTAVSCFLLLFCTIRIFVQFGVVILMITVLSCVFALVFLPAVLMTVGPCRGKREENPTQQAA